MSYFPRRFTTAFTLLALMVVASILGAINPGSVRADPGPDEGKPGTAQLEPGLEPARFELCPATGSPFGPFDLQTYEAADYRTSYPRTMDLAAFNQLFPDRPSFALQGIEGVNPSPYIPPVLLKAIAWIESGWSQASYDPLVPYGEVGPTLVSNDCGYGIMQITSGMQNVTGIPTLDQAMIGGHYAFNIARGARILADKWNAAPEFRPIVGSRNTTIIEDWYYALWSYNGFAFKNHPLNPALDPNRQPYRCDGTQPRSAYPYQELVFGCVANPPRRGGTPLWAAQPVNLPNLNDPTFRQRLDPANWGPCSQNLQCAPMNIPTPSPWHVDPVGPAVPREQVIGTPSLGLSTGSISLAAVPGGESLPAGLTISNLGTGVLGWRATSTAPWLRTSRYQGVSLGGDLGGISHTLQVTANASGLPPGTYTGAISIESLYGHGVPYTLPVSLQVSLQAAGTVSGDFTGDGRSDIIFLCCSDYASLWINQGSDSFTTRTFQPWPAYNLQAGVWQAGDFDRDGRTDLAHLCCEDFANVWLSNGDGTFRIRAFRPWPGYGMQSGSWRTGDFNGDGKTDLLHLCCNDHANAWLSNGDGSFSIAPFSPWRDYSIQAGSWQTADVNGDGRTDAVHLCCGDFANTWLSNGNGTFTIAAFRPWPGYGLQSGFWIAGNLNNDGKADLVHYCCGDYVQSWLSSGDGSFAVVAFRPWPGYQLFSGALHAGDVDGDGTMDLLHQCCSDYVHPWLSTGDGRFALGVYSPWPGYGIQMGTWQSGDFTGDGKMDLLHMCCRYVHVWQATVGGNFVVGTFVP